MTVDHSLVVENYYDHDIAYQTKYDAITNRNLLDHDLVIDYLDSEKMVNLDFGTTNDKIQGSVTFYRPSNSRYDKEYGFELHEEKGLSVSTKELKYGRWIMKVNWNDEKREYYKEEEIYVGNI